MITSQEYKIVKEHVRKIRIKRNCMLTDVDVTLIRHHLNKNCDFLPTFSEVYAEIELQSEEELLDSSV